MTDTRLSEERVERADTPREAFARLPRAAAVGVVAALVLVSAAAWAYTVREAGEMSGMVMGLGQVGGGMQMTMAAPSFVAMWAVMMVAMMSPTLAPVAVAHRAVARRVGGRAVSTWAFVVGFLAVWGATGVVGLGGYRLVLEIRPSADGSRWLPTVAGAVLVGVGLLQLTPWKRHCLQHCRRPMASVGDSGAAAALSSSFRAGLAHGWRCLGCCWALMVVLLVVGIMNLAWMAVITVIFLVDKHWARVEGLTRAVAVFFIVLGLAVIAFPDLLAYISGVEPDAPGGGGMGALKM